MKIKRWLVFLVLAAMVVNASLYSTAALSKAKDKIVITIGSPHMLVNGVKKEIDPGKNTSPQDVSGKIYMPIEAVMKEMGGQVT